MFFADSRDEAPPHWPTYFNEIELQAVEGYAYDVLADHVPDAAARAVPTLERVIAQRGPEYARSRTLNLINLASANFRDPDRVTYGVKAGYHALDGLRTLNSPRALTRLRRLDRVAARHATRPEVAEFRADLRRALANAV
jgi:hypothetical protein